MDQVPFPEGTGKLLKRGAFLVFQMHYTATGKPETDTTQLGLYLAPAKPAAELRTAAAYTTSFSIPPGAPNHSATAEFTLPFDAVLHEMSPPGPHYRVLVPLRGHLSGFPAGDAAERAVLPAIRN